MTINFLQIAIAQWEHNNKLKGTFHCTIGLNIDTFELVRLYPVDLWAMRKNCLYNIEVEPMTCKRENSFKPIAINQIGIYTSEQTTNFLNRLPVTSIEELNKNKLSMGIIDVSNKLITVETNQNYVEDSQFDLFEDTEHSKIKSLDDKSFSAKIKKDIRIKFPAKDTIQGYRNLSYNEFHFFIGLSKNGSIPNYYNKPEWSKMIVGNMRNHRSTFIGLCLFKNL
jgi:hypothetical protein